MVRADLAGTILRIVGIVVILIIGWHLHVADIFSSSYESISVAANMEEFQGIIEDVAIELSSTAPFEAAATVVGILIFIIGALFGPKCYIEAWPKWLRELVKAISIIIDIIFPVMIVIWFLGVVHEALGIEDLAFASTISKQFTLASSSYVVAILFFALGLLSRFIDAALASTKGATIAAILLVIGVIINVYAASIIVQIVNQFPDTSTASDMIAKYMKNPQFITFEEIRDTVALIFKITANTLVSLNMFLIILPFYTLLYGIGEHFFKARVPPVKSE